MTQETLNFEDKNGTVIKDGDIVEYESPKLSRQEKLIVELFKRQGGKATNLAMGALMQRFGGRLFTLKKKGYAFEIIKRGKNSVNTYEMTVKP